MLLLATFIDSNSSESISIWRFLDQTESQVFFQKFVYTFVWLVCRHVKQHVDWLIKSKQSKAEEVHCFHATTRAKPMFLIESEEVIIQLAHSSSSSFDSLFLQLLIMQYHQSLFCYVPLTYYKRATASKSRQDESIGGDKKKRGFAFLVIIDDVIMSLTTWSFACQISSINSSFPYTINI